MYNLGNYSTYLSPHYQNSCFLNLKFCFFVLGSIVSINICKLRHKLKNAKNYPKSLGHDKINLDLGLSVWKPTEIFKIRQCSPSDNRPFLCLINRKAKITYLQSLFTLPTFGSILWKFQLPCFNCLGVRAFTFFLKKIITYLPRYLRQRCF